MATSASGLLSGGGGSSSTTGTGLGQGIDVQAFVTLALSADQANITQLQSSETNFQSQSTALQKITSDLTALQSAAFALQDPLGGLSAQNATSSNSGIATATASAAALSSSHSLTVSALATTSSYYTGAVATSTTALATGSFTVQVGTGTPANVTIDSTDNTLDGLAASINSQNIGVQASVIHDANGARLALVSQTSGAPGDLTVAGNTTGLTFNKAVTGANASLVVDGVPISSTTNVVSGAINGVTLNLVSASPATPVTLSVSSDTTQATAAINAFVSAYNTAANDITAQFAVAADGTGGGPLEADGSLREAQQQLLSAVAFSTGGTGGAVNLASIGVNLNNDGTLTVDSSTLASALSSNYSGVQSFFQNSTSGFAQNLSTVLGNLTDSGSGVLGLDAAGITQSSQSLSTQIQDLQAALSVKRQNLNLVYSQVNTTLQELPLLEQSISNQLAGA